MQLRCYSSALVAEYRSIPALLMFAVTSPLAAVAQQPVAPAAALVFDHVTLLDVDRGTLVPDQRVIVVGNRIGAVGLATEVRLPDGAQVVDATGKYLLPGLWDMHTHAGDSPEVYARLIAQGVTGIREMASTWPDGFNAIHEQRLNIAAGKLVGPRIVATGFDFYSPLCRPAAIKLLNFRMAGGDSSGPFPTEDGCFKVNGNVVDTPDEIRAWVDTLKAHGVDFVKAHGVSDRAMYFAFLAEARRVGVPAVGHLGGYDAEDAITELEASDSGLRSVEHINELKCWQDTTGKSGTPYADPLTPLPDSIADRQCAVVAQRFKRNRTWFAPTLAIHGAAIPTDSAAMTRGLAAVHRAGVPTLVGTDFGPTLVLSVQQELALFVAAGYTPAEAIRDATLEPARYFDATDSLGTVAVGKLADLVLLDADPFANIENMKQIRAVVANGRYFDRAALDELSRTAGMPVSQP